jgi:hypothetical protein
MKPNGPSWRHETGSEVLFVNYQPRDRDRDRALLVRASWLKDFLGKNNLDVVATAWYERRLLDAERTRDHPSREVYTAARIDRELNISNADAQIEDWAGD